MSLSTLSGQRRTGLIVKRFCSKCNLNTEHMLLRRWTEDTGNPNTLIKAESWLCCYCDTVDEKWSEEPKPTEETMIVRRLLKLGGDYDQIRSSTLEVQGNRVTLTLKLLPWHIVQAARRVEAARQRGFYRAGDLWRLEQHGLPQPPPPPAADPQPSSYRIENAEIRTQAIHGTPEDSWT